jgi:superfamily II DNA/RNA helicase
LKGRDLKSVIVFCSTKLAAKQLGRQLKREGLLAEDIHSDLDQKTREEIMLKFRNRKLNILVATDLLSRGIDVDNIELIINYDVPHEGEDYIHRIGRTARAESDGVAITLISEQEQFKFGRIEKLLEKEVTKSSVPEEFGDTPAYDPSRNRGRGFGGRPKGKGSGGNYRGKSSGGNYKGKKSGGNYKGNRPKGNRSGQS